MGAYRDKKGRWFTSTRYKNWTGETKQKTKRSFLTKRDALAWEREFLAKNEGSLDMIFPPSMNFTETICIIDYGKAHGL